MTSQSGIPAQGCGGLHLRRRQRRRRHGREHITHIRGARTGKKSIIQGGPSTGEPRLGGLILVVPPSALDLPGLMGNWQNWLSS